MKIEFPDEFVLRVKGTKRDSWRFTKNRDGTYTEFNITMGKVITTRPAECFESYFDGQYTWIFDGDGEPIPAQENRSYLHPMAFYLPL